MTIIKRKHIVAINPRVKSLQRNSFHLNAIEREALFACPLLAALPEEDRGAILERLRRVEAAKGARLFSEGDPAAAFYVVLSGWTRLFRAEPGGAEADVGLFGPGQSFGEAAMFLGGRFPASAQVVEPGTLARMDLGEMRALLDHRPRLAMALLGSLSLHLHGLVGRLAAMRLFTAERRVASYLLARAQEGAQEGAQTPARVSLPYDKAVLAGALGMAPEALSRAFAALRARGVEVRGREISVADPDALRRMLD